jgi:hypothetical protein
MRGHDHAGGDALGSHGGRGATGEAANHLAFGTLLKLIGGHVLTRLNERMVEQAGVFATSHKGDACGISQHGPVPRVAVEAQ